MKQFSTVILAILIFSFHAKGQNSSKTNDTADINKMYQDWSKAITTSGAKGYASFFALDAVLLPPDSKAIAGRDSIQKWMQNNMDTYSFQPTGFSQDEMRIGNGWASLRVTISGTRKPKNGGASTEATNKYLDILQKHSDGSWKFVYRMWNSTK